MPARETRREHLAAGGIDVTPMNLYHVFEVHHILATGKGEDGVLNITDRLEVTGGLQENALLVYPDGTTWNKYVLRSKYLLELVGGETQLGQPGVVVLQKDPLFLITHNGYLGDVVQVKQLIACLVGYFLYFGVREAIAHNADDNAVNIAKLVVNKGANGATGQLGLLSAHLAAQVIPNGPHMGEALLDVHINNGDPGFRGGGDEI